MTLQKAVDLFIKAKRVNELSEQTIVNYENALAPLLEYAGKDKDVSEVTSTDMLEWRIEQTNKLSLNTIRQYQNTFSIFFNFLVNMNMLAASPMNREIKVSTRLVNKNRKEYDHLLTLDEVKTIYNGQRPAQMHKNAYQRNRAMLSLLLLTGVRASTLCDIRLCDLDDEHNRLYVRTSKGDKQGYVAYPQVAQMAVHDYLKTTTYDHENREKYLFTNTQNEPYNRNSLAEAVMSAIKGYTGKAYRPHSCRHWFARTLVLNGMSESEVGKLLMHSDGDAASVTYVYTGTDNTQQIAKCNDVFNRLFACT